MKPMLVGPLTENEAQTFLKYLNDKNIEAEITVDQGDVDQYEERRSWVNSKPRRYIPIDQLRLLSLKIYNPDELTEEDKIYLGIVAIEETDSGNELAPEFLCPVCTYISENPGKCPQDKNNLLDYSSWLEQKHKSDQQRQLPIIILIGLIFFMFMVWFTIFRR